MKDLDGKAPVSNKSSFYIRPHQLPPAFDKISYAILFNFDKLLNMTIYDYDYDFTKDMSICVRPRISPD